MQELKQLHSAELQKAQLEQAPLQPLQADSVGSSYKLPLVDTLTQRVSFKDVLVKAEIAVAVKGHV